MKFLLLFLIVAHPLFGIEDQDDPFRQHASPWVKTWDKEWDGVPWLICVEGEEQYLLHSKSVKEWADQRPFLGHPFDRARNAEELFGPLVNQLPLQPGTYDPPFRRTLHPYLKLEDAFVFQATLESSDGDPKPFWIVMDRDGHVLFTFHWCYSSRYEFPLVFAAAREENLLRFNYPYPSSRRLYPNFKDEDFPPPFKQPTSLVQRAKNRSLYALDPKTKQPIRLYIYNKGACVVYASPSAELATLDWSSSYWNRHVRQTPKEIERLEAILDQFIDFQMDSKAAPADCRKEIELLLIKGRERGRLFHQEREKERKQYFQLFGWCHQLIAGTLPQYQQESLHYLSLAKKEDIQSFLLPLNLPLNRFYPDAKVDVKCQVPYCTERWIQKIWKGKIQIYETDWRQKRSFRCTLIPDNTGKNIRIAYSIVECSTENMCREALADRRFWRPFNEHEESVEEVLLHTRVHPGLVGEYDLSSSLRMNYRGMIIPESETATIIFRRGNTIVALVASDPHYSVLSLAKKIDQELKKIYMPRYQSRRTP